VYCGEGTTKVEWQRRRRRWRRCDPHPLKTVLLTLGILLGSWVYGIDGKPLIRSFGRSAQSSFPMLRMCCSMTDAARDAILRRRQDGDVVIPSIKVFMAITIPMSSRGWCSVCIVYNKILRVITNIYLVSHYDVPTLFISLSYIVPLLRRPADLSFLF
jgi:hypothetical protein